MVAPGPAPQLGSIDIRLTRVDGALLPRTARAIIQNVPLAASGHRYGDLLLHDGAPEGTRILDGREVPVFNALQLLHASDYGAYTVHVRVEGADDMRAVAAVLLATTVLAVSCGGSAPVADTSPAVTVIADGAVSGGSVGVVVDAQLRVVTVEAGGAAEQAGIRVGDEIAAINGIPVSSIAELRQALAGTVLPVIEPTEALSTTPGAQAILDATGAAIQAQTPTSDLSVAVSIELLRGEARVTVRVVRQPTVLVGVNTATPVPDDFWYF